MTRRLLLFFTPALIWGSTWLVITLQLGSVSPLISVFYRFFLSALILFTIARLQGQTLRYPLHIHGRLMLFGGLLFGLNYAIVYWAEIYISSGLVAVLFSSLIFMNILNARIFSAVPVQPAVLLGALIGFSGILLVFFPEFYSLNADRMQISAVIAALISAYMASLGNISSAAVQKKGVKVIPGNAWAMLYGSLQMLLLALILGIKPSFLWNAQYILSLLYLSLFGSVIAFSTYLTLLGEIGAGKAAYVTLIVPVIALLFSTFFENYQWSVTSALGIILVVSGNALILRRRQEIKEKR